MDIDNARSLAAKNKNNKPCAYCQRNRQKCEAKDGYPCESCKRSNRSDCRPVITQTFIPFDPSKHSTRKQTANMQSGGRSTNPPPSTSTATNRYPQTMQASHISRNGYSACSNTDPHRLQSRDTFGHMQLINPNGTSNGFVKSFIHEQNNAKYYGARYYDPEGNFIKEDLFLSRVGVNDTMQMDPPLPQASYRTDGYSQKR